MTWGRAGVLGINCAPRAGLCRFEVAFKQQKGAIDVDTFGLQMQAVGGAYGSHVCALTRSRSVSPAWPV
jgi:hypothetical protein